MYMYMHVHVYGMAATGEDGGESALEERFQKAAERMRQNAGLVLANEQKLELYGYYKQVV